MSVFARLQEAKYKGFSFLVRTETKEGGKKIVTHEYVNTDQRFTEELGELPPKFSMEAVIHGLDAIERRKEFERVLNLPDAGELVHPIYGILQAKSTTYSVTSNQNTIGEFTFSVNFEVSETVINPAPELQVSESLATISAEEARAKIFASMERQYKVPKKRTALDRLAFKLEKIYDKVFDNVDAVQGTIQDKVSELTRTVNNAKSKIRTIIQKAKTMKEALKDLYRAGLDVANTPAELVDAWRDLTDFGFASDINPFGSSGKSRSSSDKVNTADRIDIDISTNILNESTRLIALVNLYEAIAFKEFDTIDDIDKSKDLLNLTYNNLMELQLINNSDGFSDAQLTVYTPIANDHDVRKAIQTLRSDVNKILNQKEQNAWNTDKVTEAETSLTLLTYRYYGDMGNIELLSNLNPNVNHSNFNNTVDIISK